MKILGQILQKVFADDDIEAFDLQTIGPKIENHQLFPEKCNVTLAKVMNKNLIKVKVWERGAGLTKACGTAACATAVAANINNLVEKTTDIEFALGKPEPEDDLSGRDRVHGIV